MKPRTRTAQGGGARDEATGGVVPAIHPSAPYERDAEGRYPGGHSYTRDQNPGFDAPEALLAELEGGARALLFASGMAAAAAALEPVPRGAHVLAPRALYFTAGLWLDHLAAEGRLVVERYANADPDDLARRLRADTALVWAETPSNPLTEVTDLAATAELAHGAGARLLVDGTLATPVLTRPFEHGADLVVHSATKQLNGHADLVAGAVVVREEDAWLERIAFDRAYRGAILGPFEAWLLLRGMRTLHLRVEASSASAQRIAEGLGAMGGVSQVLYPGMPDHPGHRVAARQMTGGFGPLVSFRLVGGVAAARRVAAGLRVFRNASSLGGVESLVEHRAPVEGPGTEVPDDLLRLSIGIEDPDDLLEDLEQALAAAR